MNLLRAKVFNNKSGWVIQLVDLDIMAEGHDESSMLKQLEYLLIAEVDVAPTYGMVPFARLVKTRREDRHPVLTDDSTNLRMLDLPEDVKEAIDHALYGTHGNGGCDLGIARVA
jgi:hypothetical protein